MAKQIILDAAQVFLPALKVRAEARDWLRRIRSMQRTVIEASKYSIDCAQAESQQGNLRPDIVARINGRPIWIELAFTHYCGPEKKRELRERAIDSVEIDLSIFGPTTSKVELEEYLLSGIVPEGRLQTSKWLFHRRAAQAHSRLQEELQRSLELEEKKRKQFSRNYEVVPAASRAGNISTSSRQPSKQATGLRWLACRTCFRAFSLTKEEVLENCSTVDCPHCGAKVSTAR